MKIKILNIEENDSIFTKKDLLCEKRVFAIFNMNGKQFYLIDASNDFTPLPLHFKSSQNYLIIDEFIPEDWVYTKKFVDNYTDPCEGIVRLKKLYCPQWMLDDKSFFFEAFLNRDLARIKILKHLKYND